MEIKADKEGQAVIQQLCDVALRMDGLKAMQGIANILQSVQPIEEEEDEKPLELVNPIQQAENG